MQVTWLLILTFATFLGHSRALWNNLNCPAPRSPENGLNFIFRNGELVHFRCHPGYAMHGKSVAYCVNSQWSVPPPECKPLKKGRRQNRAYDERNYYTHQLQPQRNLSLSESRQELNSKLFNWNKQDKTKGVYGDGPRRVPIINGIWPGQPDQVMSLGPQSTPGPIQLVREEVNIAELRQKQYEEVAHHRHMNPNLDLLPSKKQKKKRRNKIKKDALSNNAIDSRETLISLGKTEEGDALSIAFATPINDTTISNHHKYRHRDSNKKRKKGKGKKFKKHFDYPSNIIARSSRVDTSGYSPFHINKKRTYSTNQVAELRHRPIEKVQDKEDTNLARFDTSCIESFYGRDLPMMAPHVSNAFVYRYETKKNKDLPFNSYMQVKYRCLTDYTFADVQAQVLFCRDGKWVGKLPNCISN